MDAPLIFLSKMSKYAVVIKLFLKIILRVSNMSKRFIKFLQVKI